MTRTAKSAVFLGLCVVGMTTAVVILLSRSKEPAPAKEKPATKQVAPASSQIGYLYPGRGYGVVILRDEPRHVTCYLLDWHEALSCVRDVEAVPCRQEPKSN